jgi:hypothetical protein
MLAGAPFAGWEGAGAPLPLPPSPVAQHRLAEVGGRASLGRLEIIRPRDITLVRLLGYGSIGEVGLCMHACTRMHGRLRLHAPAHDRACSRRPPSLSQE